MRPVLHGDVVAMARVLLALPACERWAAMNAIITEARYADCYRKRTGRAHFQWGNGSLMAAATSRKMLPEPFLNDLEYCRCLEMVFGGLIAQRCEMAALNQHSANK